MANEDEAAIRSLLTQYCYYFDGGLADQWAALFTEDGVWIGEAFADNGHADQETRGREALATLCRTANVNGLKYRHLTLNTAISVSGNEARANSYVLVIHLISDGLKVNSCRYYDDHLVKDNARWLIRKRLYAKTLSPAQIIV